MKIFHRGHRSFLYTSLLISTLSAGPLVHATDDFTRSNDFTGSDNLRFSGQLVEQPCIIEPDNETIKLEFDSIVEQSLYIYGRSSARPFILRLSECDLSVGNKVRVAFNGQKSLALPNLLAVNSGSTTSGIAIALETMDGNPLPLGKDTTDYLLLAGRNEITFKAYVQAEPEAIAKKNIVLGPFTATATFYIEYE